MKILIDTCIIIDVLQKREPFFDHSKSVCLICANKKVEGFLTAKSITDIYYYAHKLTHNDKTTRETISKLIDIFDLIDTEAEDIRKAVLSETADFEDAVMIETACRSKIDTIITRNIKDYKKANVQVFTPLDFLKYIEQTKGMAD